ncbi:DNA-binding response regulator [Xylanimonas oleitrophica]|uniref:DNA-binding response regulator n=1 Tax=Xylanimonas oleitrophica TaxID=2607479 RepID=A0A2W5XUH5_9MICO|nr:DNA-binding response regulator [Xylanimonas oleitrophica]
MNVAVVDDEETSRRLLASHLERYEQEHGTPLRVTTFEDGARIAEPYRPEFDVVFLDVQMPGMDGFETARRIRELDTDVVLVFVTNMAQHAIRGYEVEALSYLVKPVPYFAFSQELRRSVRRVRRGDRDSIMLPAGGSTARVDLADVLYVESDKHRITVHARDRAYTLTGTLKSFETELAGKGFFRSNSCYLVNLRHVVGVHPTSCVMRGGIELQVSRPRRRAFLDALTDHVGGRLP